MRIKNQTGFTLVEMAIVLAVIGLLVVGVVKGQEWYTNAKMYKLQSEFEKYESVIGLYFIKTGKTTPGGNYSGGFNERFWQDLRGEGLVEGEASDDSSPVSALGDAKHNLWVARTGSSGNSIFRHGLYLCTTGVPEGIAKAIDLKLDDGKGKTGKIKSLKYLGFGSSTNSGWRSDKLLDYADNNIDMIMCKLMQRRYKF